MLEAQVELGAMPLLRELQTQCSSGFLDLDVGVHRGGAERKKAAKGGKYRVY